MISKIEIAEAIIEEMGNQAAMDLLTVEGYVRWLNGQPIRDEDLAVDSQIEGGIK